MPRPARSAKGRHPSDVFKEAEDPLRKAASHLLSAIAYAGANEGMSRLRTGDAVIRVAIAVGDIGLAFGDHCAGRRLEAARTLAGVRLALHAEAGRLIGPRWEFGRVSDVMAHEVRRLLDGLPVHLLAERKGDRHWGPYSS